MTHRVLVCDDHPIVRDAIRVCLKAIAPDCEVDTCGTVRQLVERLAAPGHWDLVVLDLELPDATGVDAVIEVRRVAPELRVAVLSAREDRATIERALRAGAVAFLPKSSERGWLVESLQRLLGIVPAPQPARGPGHRAGGGPTPAPGAVRDESWAHEALASMSPRQMQVLRLLLRGLPNKEICRDLGVSENTVKIHISGVLRVLRVRNRTEAVGLASRIGFGLG